MIETLFFNPRLLHQTTDDDSDVPCSPIAACHDATGLVVLSQECREICINRASIPELTKLLKQMQNEKLK